MAPSNLQVNANGNAEEAITLWTKQFLGKLLVLTILLLSTIEVSSQNLTQQQYLEDLAFFKTELANRHKNLFSVISEKEFNQKIAEIEKKSSSLTKESFEIELFKIIKAIGDEHTFIVPDYQTSFPITFDIFEEGIFVTKTDSAHSNLLYQQLNGIGSKATKNILEDFKTIINTENQSYFEVNFLNLIRNPRVLMGLNLATSEANGLFQLGGEKHNILAIQKRDYSPLISPDYLRYKKKDKYWYELIDNGNILYFNYQSCSEQKNKPFETFNEELFSSIEKNKPRKIIIDLRNNSGGNSGIFRPFLEKLKKSGLNTKGSLYVLIGKNTFSSALMNAVDLKRNFNSILIGESTSGNVNHYGEVRGFDLPNSKIEVGYSTKYWEVWKGHKGPLVPDVGVKYSIANVKQNVDEAVEYVRKQN